MLEYRREGQEGMRNGEAHDVALKRRKKKEDGKEGLLFLSAWQNIWKEKRKRKGET